MAYKVTYDADALTARMAVIDAANALPEVQRSRIIRAIYTQPVERTYRQDPRGFWTITAALLGLGLPLFAALWIGSPA